MSNTHRTSTLDVCDMYMMFNNYNTGWSLGLLYTEPEIPEHLKIFFRNNQKYTIHDLTTWLANHSVRGIAYCCGSRMDKWRSRRFIKQFNRNMEKMGALADLGEFYQEVIKVEIRMGENEIEQCI